MSASAVPLPACVSSDWCLLQEGKSMFEQELYHSFSISSSRSYFISFAGDVSVCTCAVSALVPLQGF